MRMTDISVGMEVRVLRGYSLRPAVVTEVWATQKKVCVRYTDVTPAEVSRIPEGYRSNVLGAVVRPQAIQPSKEQ